MKRLNRLVNKNIHEDFVKIYLDKLFFFENEKKNFWEKLNSYTDCYIFGGVILDIFTGRRKHRDIDITVLDLNKKVIELIESYHGVQNSFGGFKIKIENIIFDIWQISETWSIKKNNTLGFDLKNFLPSTVFFNSQAILYSVSENKLYYNEEFLKFLYQKKIDILNPDNPLPELCILKSFEYSIRNYSFENNLKEYLKKYYALKKDKLRQAQIKHYGIEKYDLKEIETFINNLQIRKKLKSKTTSKDKYQLELF